MSDIGFCGLIASLVALATIALGALWFCVAFAWSLLKPRGERLVFAWRVAFGGVACACIGVAAIILANFEPFKMSCTYDDFSWLIPLLGIAAGIVVVRFRVRRTSIMLKEE
ncbi:MAG: hypothetical protein ABI183_18395 [Polyangiaceae bacterium]